MKQRQPPALAGRGPRRQPEAQAFGRVHHAATSPGRDAGPPRGLTERIAWVPIGRLKAFPGNPRSHPELQIAALMRSIERVWTNPILIDKSSTILAGHGRLEAARRLGMAEVPTLTIAGLNEAEKRAIVIADNRLPERAVWDFELLQEHFKKLIEIDFEVELTGFSTGEVDLLMDGKAAPASADPSDDLSGLTLDGPAVSATGDLWELGPHRLLCGDALHDESYEALLKGELAQMIVTDPPFNVRIQGHAMGRGRVRHREFAMASGEMSEPAFGTFLETFIRRAQTHSANGSIHFVFMDWRHLPVLLNAARPLYAEWKNLIVWNKSNAGQGSFYRSKHEMIAVFKHGTGPPINNFGLGATGRYRTNVQDYPSVNGLHPARRGDLELHPTVKPVALVADLIRDCSRRNGLILDPFGGSGTTILAAARTGRVARMIELDPIYVNVAVRRWERTTGMEARHAATGLSFGQLATEREVDPAPRSRARTGG